MFKVQPWMLDEEGYLKDIEDFAHVQDVEIQKFYRAYHEIHKVFSDMYMDHMEVLDWKITQIVLRMLYHQLTCQGIFILYCAGANGKTT